MKGFEVQHKDYPEAEIIFTVVQVTINGRLTKPHGYEDVYFPGSKRHEYRPTEARKVFTTGDKKEYLAKKKEWLEDYQNVQSAKKAAVAAKKMRPVVSEQIKEIVKVLFENQRAQVLADLEYNYASNLQKLMTVEGPVDKEKWESVIYFSFRGRREMTSAGNLSNRIMHHREEDRHVKNPGVYLRPNYKERIAELIQYDLKAIMDSFLAKMESKLQETIKTKTLKEFRAQGMHQGFVQFKFEDGAEFHMQNSIEWGSSKFGKQFQRFPCRFHDVTMSDGSKMKGPSEEKMKKEF